MIALFDSGIGGLTVLKPVLKELPQYDYLYLGDSARSPYGSRSEESIKQFSEEAVEYLFNRGVKLIIFACNTASSVALRHVQQKYLKGAQEKDRKILGVLIPVAEEAAEQSKKGRVGVVGTKAMALFSLGLAARFFVHHLGRWIAVRVSKNFQDKK